MVEQRYLVQDAEDERSLQYECPDIYLDDNIMTLKFSPTQNVLSLGQITGEIRLYTYTEDETKEQVNLTHHSESVRCIDYNTTGRILYACSADKSFSVISSGRLEGRLVGSHDEAINTIMHLEDDHIVATGDDDGVVKVWDLRLAN